MYLAKDGQKGKVNSEGDIKGKLREEGTKEEARIYEILGRKRKG